MTSAIEEGRGDRWFWSDRRTYFCVRHVHTNIISLTAGPTGVHIALYMTDEEADEVASMLENPPGTGACQSVTFADENGNPEKEAVALDRGRVDYGLAFNAHYLHTTLRVSVEDIEKLAECLRWALSKVKEDASG